MAQVAVPAHFIRGGTSKGLFFRTPDLPPTPAARDAFLLAALGSPDPNGRQLDGLGGGVSSLSKIMIVDPSTRPEVDVDYHFGQVAVDAPLIDWRANCGNLSAAVGVYAVAAGLVSLPDGEATIRMFNVNTAKRVDCTLRVEGGEPAVDGDCAIAGVAGRGAPIRLDFLDPGGAATGSLLPTGRPLDRLALPDGDAVDASIVDASNLCVFVRAADLGLSGTETPIRLRADAGLVARMEAIRAAAAVAAGVAPDARSATREMPTTPKIAMVAPPAAAPLPDGGTVAAGDCHVQVRMFSMGVPHLAIPLTGALCTAVAAKIAGTVVAEVAADAGTPEAANSWFRVGHAAGVLPVAATVCPADNGWRAASVSVLRTARVLMAGRVFVPAGRLLGA